MSDANPDTIAEATIISAKATVTAAKATKLAAIITAISLLVSVFAIGISIYAARLTRQQNINAEQQELLSTVTDIEQLQNSPQSFERTLADAESAQYIMNSLHNTGIPSVEEYEVGIALEKEAVFRPALTLVERAARGAPDPVDVAQSWREAANIQYTLRQTKQAERDMILARTAFTVSNSDMINVENNIAFTDFYDIPRISAIGPAEGSPGCRTSEAEWKEALQKIHQYPHILTPSVQHQEGIAKESLRNNCQYP
jgi:hypothetical protein